MYNTYTYFIHSLDLPTGFKHQLRPLPSSYTLLSPGNQHVQGLTHYDAVHGTQVYVLQNDSAVDTWPLEHNDMEQLRNAMSYNREWG